MPPNLHARAIGLPSLLPRPVQIRARVCRVAVWRQSVLYESFAARVTQWGTPRRSLHLYKTARSTTLLGQHKIRLFEKYNVAPPSQSQHRVNLVRSGSDPTPLATNISLQELYDDYVKPGEILYLTNPLLRRQAEHVEILQKENVASESRDYAICKPYEMVKEGSREITLRPQHGHQLGELKNIMIRLSSPMDYFKICLDRAWQFINAGSPVEFRIRLRGSSSKSERQERGSMWKWEWMHEHWPHIRPDFILKSMPEGSLFLIEPVSDGYIVQFVISLKAKIMPNVDLNRRLWKIKDGVNHSIREGKQSQLPKQLRQTLHEGGNTSYSPTSGLTRTQALAGYTKDKSVAKWGFDGGEEPVKLTEAARKAIDTMKSRSKGLPRSDSWEPEKYMAKYDKMLNVARRGKLMPYEIRKRSNSMEGVAEQEGKKEDADFAVPIRKYVSGIERLTDTLPENGRLVSKDGDDGKGKNKSPTWMGRGRVKR